MRFAGKVAIVTGGAGGIGRAVVDALAAEGATVIAADLSPAATAPPGAAAVAPGSAAAASGAAAVAPGPAAAPPGAAAVAPGSIGESAASTGTRGRILPESVDVREPRAVAALVTRTAADLGPPRILVTLAGGSLGTPRDLPDITPADLDAVLDVNLKGTFHCCQAVAPLMAAAGGGAIVTCSSIGARQPSPVTGAPYAAAKAAIGGLTRRLARELGPAGIRVNAIAPGLFLTPRLAARFDAMPPSERAEVVDAIPLGRMPELREIVEPILFLASDAASFITGVTLDVNGGRYLPP